VSTEFSENRYDRMVYRRCGRSGLKLPAISLGCWYNFGNNDDAVGMRNVLRRAFDLGVTHFDLANNYGPPPGSAEDNVGRYLKQDFAAHRDELIISTKAGYDMWPGPYGDWGSRKYLVSSLDQSLQRLRLDYVDIFYHHRPDPETPLEETLGALDQIVRQGKALYAGISNYRGKATVQAQEVLGRLGTPLTIHQARYSMFDRWVEDDLLDQTGRLGVGVIVFSPLEQGVLTGKYLQGVPEGSRAAKPWTGFRADRIKEEQLKRVRKLNKMATARGQSLAQMALSWVLRDERVTSALVGASRVDQIEENVAAADRTDFSADELKAIEKALA
jgi:L-glyceraldehyde 3-phosphate reductase